MYNFFDTFIGKTLIAIAGYLIGKLVEIIIHRISSDRSKRKDAFAKFHNTFVAFIQQLEFVKGSPNAIIVGEFKRLDLAKREFAQFLSGSRKIKFNSKWAEYEEEHNQINNFGEKGIVISFAPNVNSLLDNSDNPKKKSANWEKAKKERMLEIINDLVKIANVN